MRERVRKILLDSAAKWAPLPPFEVERPKVQAHGELSTNLAMTLAKKLGEKPIEIAREIIRSLRDPEGIVERAEPAGPGFINFVFKRQAWQESLRNVLKQGENFGRTLTGTGARKKAVIEFVSANPTGPLHIGNARGGPLGDVLASLLEMTGHEVTREYYVNDVGGQIDKLGESILYWMKHEGEEGVEPPKEYKGDYVKELAQEALKQHKFKKALDASDATSPVAELGQFGIKRMLEQIKEDCTAIGICFKSWEYESEMLNYGQGTEHLIEKLELRRIAIRKEGAIWFAPGDEFLQDRECVLVRSDGRPTYFANDIAYHVGKFVRGFDRIINVWGSNHHGHVPRIKAAMKALGFDPGRIETVLYQFVRVKRGNETVKMSKRAGDFVTAREVLDEVGRDAFRFFLLMRAPESHLDFDLELAKKHSHENPVYYVQYAHARLAAIERKAAEMKIPPPQENSVRLNLLVLPEEIELIRLINEFPGEVERAALRLEPHRIPFYLLEVTKLFQSAYTKAREDPRYKVLSADIDTSQAKMYLCAALKLTLSQGLKLLGVSAPELMIKED